MEYVIGFGLGLVLYLSILRLVRTVREHRRLVAIHRRFNNMFGK